MVKAHAKATKPVRDSASERSSLSRTDWHMVRVIVFGVLKKADILFVGIGWVNDTVTANGLWNVRQLTPLELLGKILLIKCCDRL